MPDEESEYKAPPTIEECAKEGHCHCIGDGGYTCCWCGYFDPEKAKVARLKHLETQVKYVVGLYPAEAKEVMRKYL